MTIRNKLILSSGGMLALILLIGAVSFWSLYRWQEAASLVELDRSRTYLVDQIRKGMNQQGNYGISHLSGGPAELVSFWETEKELTFQLIQLRELATRTEEVDHIQGFEETMFELSWVVKGILEGIDSSSSEGDRSHSMERLREISDEIADDVAVLHRYYRRQVDESVSRASEAGNTAAWVIGLGLCLALVQVLALIFVSQVWLVKPIARVGLATARISQGDLETRLDIKSHDEWGTLAHSINEMALSLKNFQLELQTKERLAAVGEVAAYTAHNIRNPLAGIRAAAQVALKALNDSDPSSREVFEDIIGSVDRMERWIKALMNFAAPLDIKRTSSSIGEMIEEISDLLAEKSRKDGVKLLTRIEPDLRPVMIDADLFGQALANIITNGIESGTDRVEISASPNSNSTARPEVQISVRDYGRGIDPEIEPRLFHAFTTNKSGGTGLGLAQAKKIVELHGGKLSIASEPGQGTTVSISISLDEIPSGELSLKTATDLE